MMGKKGVLLALPQQYQRSRPKPSTLTYSRRDLRSLPYDIVSMSMRGAEKAGSISKIRKLSASLPTRLCSTAWNVQAYCNKPPKYGFLNGMRPAFFQQRAGDTGVTRVVVVTAAIILDCLGVAF